MQISEDSLIRDICRESFSDFVKEFWSEINTEPLVWNWHMQYLCDELQKLAENLFEGKPRLYDLIINISPGSSKSTICSQMFPAWCWTRMPSCSCIGASYSQHIAMNNSRKERDIVKSEKFKRLFKVYIRRDQDGKSYFMNYAGGYRYAVGIGGSVTGMHGHFLIVDDPLNPREANSDKDLETANIWMTETLPSRKINKETAVTILIMQRLHEDDCTGHIINTESEEEKKSYKLICLPAELDENVQPPELAKHYSEGLMDPIRLNRSVLAGFRRQLGEYAYAGQFLQNPIPRIGALFTPENLIPTPTLPGPIDKMIRYWDKAGTQAAGCYTAGVKMARLKDGAYIILDCVRGQWEPFRRNKIILQTAQLDGFACQVALEQEPGSGGKESGLISVRELAGFKVTLDKPVGDKATRAEPLSSQIAAGNVYILQGDWNSKFIEEMRLFPNSRYKDQVDAASAAFNMLAMKQRLDYRTMVGKTNSKPLGLIPEKLAHVQSYQEPVTIVAGVKLPVH